MALTATANKRTIADIDTQLKLKPGHASFTQSFNRTNLTYRVLKKKGSPTNEIVNFIKQDYPNNTGVIYCTARFTCEKVAEDLRKHGLNAAHFHAGMPTAEKDQTVRDWQNNTVHIIVATVGVRSLESLTKAKASFRSPSEWALTKRMVSFCSA